MNDAARGVSPVVVLFAAIGSGVSCFDLLPAIACSCPPVIATIVDWLVYFTRLVDVTGDDCDLIAGTFGFRLRRLKLPFSNIVSLFADSDQ